MTAQEVLDKVLEAGGRVIRDPARPRLLVPASLRPLVAAHREALRALVLDRWEPPRPPDGLTQGMQHRVDAFLVQVAEWVKSGRAGLPLLVLPDAPAPRLGACISCGSPIPETRWRCSLCLTAVAMVLGMEPQEVDQ